MRRRKSSGRVRSMVGVLLVAVVTALALSVVPATPGAAAAAKTKIVWMTWNAGFRLEEYQRHAEQFEKLNPDIDVDIQSVPWEQIPTKLATAVAGGTGPDLASVDPAWFNGLVEKGLLDDLMPLIKADRSGFDYGDVAAPAVQMWKDAEGVLRAFPHDLDIQQLMYNADLFDQYGLWPPDARWNWDDMLSAAQRLTRDFNNDGKLEQWGFSSWFFDWYSLIWANGGDILTPDLKASALNTPAARQAIEYWGKYYPARLHLMPDYPAETGAGVYPWTLFIQGKVAMQPSGAWFGSNLADAKVAFTVDAVEMPLSPAGKRATFMSGQGLSIIVGSKHKQEAFRFILFLTSKEVQSTNSVKLNQQPVTVSVLFSEAFLKGQTPPKNRLPYAIAARDYARSQPKHPRWSEVSGYLSSDIGAYFGGRVSIDQAIATFAEHVAAITARLAGKK